MIIVGNLKMNKAPLEVSNLIKNIETNIGATDIDVTLSVPFVAIDRACGVAKNTRIKIGAQNCHYESSGACTGEISADMLVACGAKSVILGHSERRLKFHETDEIINKKVRSALAVGLDVILCVGETAEEKKRGISKKTITTQVEKALREVSKRHFKKLMVAYEPVWAIGTNQAALTDYIEEMCANLKEHFDNVDVKILYGGAVNSNNSESILKNPSVDGLLVGKASLDAKEFSDIILSSG